MLNKAMHKTRLTHNTKAKHTSNAKTKKQEEEREKQWQNHLESFSFHTLEDPFRLVNPWSSDEREEFKPFKFERNVKTVKRSPRGAKEAEKWFWFPDAIMLLHCWVANHL